MLHEDFEFIFLNVQIFFFLLSLWLGGELVKLTLNNQSLQLLHLLRRVDSLHPATHGSFCRL